MKLVIIGYGKLGRLFEKAAVERGHRVLMVVDPFVSMEKSEANIVMCKSLDSILNSNEKPDMAFEATHPDRAGENLLFLAKEKISAVSGTTGWYNRLPEIKNVFEKAETSLFWAPNFSLGMNIFYKIAEYCARAFDPFPEYDAGGFEIHHNKKADSPSGTAKIIAEKILSNMTRKKSAVYEILDRPPAPDELHFASVRAGSVPGLHSVMFDSPADTVEITHTLRSREGLAAGAIRAAEWLYAKKEKGVYTMDDMLSEMFGNRPD